MQPNQPPSQISSLLPLGALPSQSIHKNQDTSYASDVLHWSLKYDLVSAAFTLQTDQPSPSIPIKQQQSQKTNQNNISQTSPPNPSNDLQQAESQKQPVKYTIGEASQLKPTDKHKQQEAAHDKSKTQALRIVQFVEYPQSQPQAHAEIHEMKDEVTQTPAIQQPENIQETGPYKKWELFYAAGEFQLTEDLLSSQVNLRQLEQKINQQKKRLQELEQEERRAAALKNTDNNVQSEEAKVDHDNTQRNNKTFVDYVDIEDARKHCPTDEDDFEQTKQIKSQQVLLQLEQVEQNRHLPANTISKTTPVPSEGKVQSIRKSSQIPNTKKTQGAQIRPEKVQLIVPKETSKAVQKTVPAPSVAKTAQNQEYNPTVLKNLHVLVPTTNIEVKSGKKPVQEEKQAIAAAIVTQIKSEDKKNKKMQAPVQSIKQTQAEVSSAVHRPQPEKAANLEANKQQVNNLIHEVNLAAPENPEPPTILINPASQPPKSDHNIRHQKVNDQPSIAIVSIQVAPVNIEYDTKSELAVEPNKLRPPSRHSRTSNNQALKEKLPQVTPQNKSTSKEKSIKTDTIKQEAKDNPQQIKHPKTISEVPKQDKLEVAASEESKNSDKNSPKLSTGSNNRPNNTAQEEEDKSHASHIEKYVASASKTPQPKEQIKAVDGQNHSEATLIKTEEPNSNRQIDAGSEHKIDSRVFKRKSSRNRSSSRKKNSATFAFSSRILDVLVDSKLGLQPTEVQAKHDEEGNSKQKESAPEEIKTVSKEIPTIEVLEKPQTDLKASKVESKEPIQTPQKQLEVQQLKKQKEVLEEEVTSLRKTIFQLKKQKMSQSAAFNIKNELSATPVISLNPNHPESLSKADSMLEYYQHQKSKKLLKYPDTIAPEQAGDSFSPDGYQTKRRVFWHAESRQNEDKIGKIIRRRFSEKKQSIEGSSQPEHTPQKKPNPAKTHALYFHSRVVNNKDLAPIIRENRSFCEQPSSAVETDQPYTGRESPSRIADTGRNSSQIRRKQRSPKADPLNKIRTNESNFKKFVADKSHIYTPEQSIAHSDQPTPGLHKLTSSHLAETSHDFTTPSKFNKQPISQPFMINSQTKIASSNLSNPTSRAKKFVPQTQEPTNNWEPEDYIGSAQKQQMGFINKMMTQKENRIQISPSKEQNGPAEISRIQDEPTNPLEQPDQKDLEFPVLPPPPTANMNSEQLIDLGRTIFEKFGTILDQDSVLNIKKYRNCVYINAYDKHILWHYTGRFYIGGWSLKNGEGQKHGDGLEYFPQSNKIISNNLQMPQSNIEYIYEGEFKNGKRNGLGTMKSINNEVYNGQWLRGLRHGKGILKEVSGAVYDGQWKEGRKHGYGKLKLPDGQSYQGLFQNGHKSGQGRERFVNGDVYQGEFSLDKFSGKGTYVWANGASYTGQFCNGSRHGKGTWRSSKSNPADVYEGDYKNDKKCGQGSYSWENGVVYIGAFENDLRHGEGVLKLENGKLIKALWQNGVVKKKILSESEVKKSAQKPLERRDKSSDRKHSHFKDSEDPLAKKRATAMYSSKHFGNSGWDDDSKSFLRVATGLQQQPYRSIQRGGVSS